MLRRFVMGIFIASAGMNVLALALNFTPWSIFGLIAGWYLADLASGVVHMLLDYRPCPRGKRLNDLYFYSGSRESDEYLAMVRERMAHVGPFDRLVYDFKNHHPRPMALGRRPVWRQIGSSVLLAALPLSILLNVVAWLWPIPGLLVAMGLSLILGGAFAQYFHGSLHRERNPAVVLLMRRCGLLMTPQAHQLHHDTLQRDFATNCGWSNPLINRLFGALRSRGYLKDEGLEPHS